MDRSRQEPACQKVYPLSTGPSSVDGLRRGNLLDRHHTVHRGKRREYEWVTGVPLNGSPDSPLINFIQFRIIKDGEVKYRNAWVTDLVPTTDNIAQLVRAARARWKIENEAFNTLKNQGYHLKHNFGHGDRHLSEALFVVNLLAFFMHPDLRAGRWPAISACAPSSVPAARSGTRCAPPSGCFCLPRGTRCWCA